MIIEINKFIRILLSIFSLKIYVFILNKEFWKIRIAKDLSVYEKDLLRHTDFMNTTYAYSEILEVIVIDGLE